jgi:chromosome segregation ATPase
MTDSERYEKLNTDVAALKTQMKSVHDSLEKNTTATSAMREDFQRLRGEINGSLPRIERSVERIFDRLEHNQETVKSYHEKVQTHAHEIGLIFTALQQKADEKANSDAHERIWLVIRISLYAIFGSLAVLLLAKAVGSI